MSSEIDWGAEVLSFSLTMLAAGIGAWLSVYKLPLAAKKEERRWSREVDAEETVLLKLSSLAFLSFDYANSVLRQEARISELSELEIQKEVFGILSFLHHRQRSLSVHLSKDKAKNLQGFIADTKDILNEADADSGLWYSDDQFEEQKHIAETIGMLGKAAENNLKGFKCNAKSSESVSAKSIVGLLKDAIAALGK